jgi:hypothetical protein
MLALNISVDTRARTEVDEETFDESEGLAEDEEELELVGDDTTAFFSWVKEASVDGEMKPVGSSVFTNGDDIKVYFAYPQGQIINHDPKIGVPYSSSSASDSAGETVVKIIPFIAAAVIGIVIVMLSVSWRRKKNGLIEK